MLFLNSQFFENLLSGFHFTSLQTASFPQALYITSAPVLLLQKIQGSQFNGYKYSQRHCLQKEEERYFCFMLILCTAVISDGEKFCPGHFLARSCKNQTPCLSTRTDSLSPK